MIRRGGVWAVMPVADAQRVIDSRIQVRWFSHDGGEGGDGGLAGGAPPSEVGAWAAPINFPVIAINASLMPTGEVLAWAYPGASQARLWNPQTGAFTAVNMNDDIFCSGQAHLADGRLYVAGGNQSGCDFSGIIDTNIFNPVTRVWQRSHNMVDGRWYPTVVTMPDGRMLIFSGLGEACESNPIVEMFTPSDGGGGGSLAIVPEGEREVDLYPRMHLLSNGRIAHVGPENSARTFQLGVGWQFTDWSNFGWRDQGTSVMLPGFPDRIMIIGGGEVTNTCEIIDYNQSSPQFVNTTPMHHARRHANATILPDKTVLVVGGGQTGTYSNPVLTPELYDPVTAQWTLLPSHVYGRMYHSTSLLLPDGRVLVAGQDSGPGALTAEIYSPPYLFRGPRPVIASAPANVAWGQAFTINTPDANNIESLVLIKLGNVTHSVTFDQRLLEVPFEVASDSRLFASAPPTANRAPPGYYMLIALNDQDVPSVAKMIRISPQRTADVNGDGAVNADDLIEVILRWGACPAPCPADINSNGQVDADDVVAVVLGWA
jgi:hypothetical protein